MTFPILFIACPRIPDAVLSSGVLKRLLDEVPQARITVAASALTAPLFRDVPVLEGMIVLEREAGRLNWLKLWQAARRRRWGAIVDLRGSGVATALRARRKLVRQPRDPAAEPEHLTVEAARLLQLQDDPPPPYLYVSQETRERAAELLPEGGPVLAIGPGGKWVGKTWPAERFALVAAEMMKPGAPFEHGRLLLLGAVGDKPSAEAIRRSIPRPRVTDLTGRTDVLTTYALLERARLFLGNDSGVTQLAAAAGAPTLALFGPSDERVYAPWGAHTRVVRGPRDYQTIRKADPELNQPICHMLDLKSSVVLEALQRLYAETAPQQQVEAVADPDRDKDAASG